MEMGILLEEYDRCRNAVIEPEMLAPPIRGFPKTAVTCFSTRLLNQVMAGREKEEICRLDTEDGGVPVYRISENGREFGVYMSRVGAPACAVQMEEMISRGASKFVMFGSCGVLDGSLGKWRTIVPVAAARDEGVSYHYLPAADEIAMQKESVAILCRALADCGEEYVLGKVWTTDAIYRETREKMERRKASGCIAVDMECASVHAVAEFRGVKLAQFFYAEDNLDEEIWDGRGLSKNVHNEAERLFRAALTCASWL